MNINREPAGTPTGGQFAAGTTGESSGVALVDPPHGLSQLGLSPGETMTLDDYDTGSRMFEQVEVTATEAGDYIVRGKVYVDLEAGLEPSGEDPEAQREWLDERRHVIEASLHDHYGAQLEDTDDGQHLVFTSRLPATAGTDELLPELENCTRASAAEHDLHGPSAGADYASAPMFTNLRRDLDEHAQATSVASASYELALEYMETDGDAGTVRMTADSRELCRRDLSMFLVENRHLLTACRRDFPDYDEKAIGGDLAYSLTGIGRAFDNGGLGGYGPQLQEAADKMPMVSTWVDKNNDLHVEHDDWGPGPKDF